MQKSGWTDAFTGVSAMPQTNHKVAIRYNGLLAKCGADSVYLRCGKGLPNHWSYVQDISMNRTHYGFEAVIDVKDNPAFICFKDSANNWDNNNGQNWIVNPM